MIKLKDQLSLAVSGLALLVSALTAYFTFHAIDDVMVRIAGFNVENTLTDHGKIITNLAFINKGNQPILITGIESIAAPKLDMSDGSFGAPVDDVKNVMPFLLDKNQMKVVTVATPLGFISDNVGSEAETIHYGLKVASINSQGKEQGAQLFFSTIDFLNNRVKTFNFEHLIVSLNSAEHVSFRIATDYPNSNSR